MQDNDNAFETLPAQKELINLILQNIPITAQGAVAVQNFRCTDHSHAVAGALTFGSDMWTRHKEGMHFVKLMALGKKPDQRMSWNYVRAALHKYKKCKDVISQIMRTIRVLDFIDDNDVYFYFRHEDTTLNVQIVDVLLHEYPHDCLIQEMGCVILCGLYDYGIEEGRFDQAYSCESSIRLAVEALLVPYRTVELVSAALKLLVSLHKINQNALQGFVVHVGTDIMGLVFDVQHEFSYCLDVVAACYKLSKVLLPTWTAPDQEETRENPGPINIILACVQENPDSLYNHRVGCKQLSLLAMKNVGRLRITENTFSCIANMIRHKKRLGFESVSPHSERHVWQFLETMLCTKDTFAMPAMVFDMFQASFDIEFLLQSLDDHTLYYNTMNTNFGLKSNHTLGIICQMILILVVRGPAHANRDRLLQIKGVETLMNAIDNHHNTHGDVLGAGLLPCVNLFLHMFGPDDNTAETHLTMTTQSSARELRTFHYGQYNRAQTTATLPSFVLLTLNYMLHNRQGHYGIHFIEALERVTQLLVMLLGKGELWCRGKWNCWHAMNNIADAIATYTRTNAPREIGVNVESYVTLIRKIVTHMDRVALTIETYRKNTLKLKLRKNCFDNYMTETKSYRAYDDTFAATLNDIIGCNNMAA